MVELKDVIGWAITGGIGSVALLLTLLTRRDARLAARKEREKISDLSPSAGAARGSAGRLFAVQVREPERNRFRFLSVRATKPRGVRLAFVDGSGKRGDVNAGAVPGDFGPILDLATAQVRPGGFRFFAERASTDTRNSSTALVIELELEEISSARRISRIPVTSQRIDWKPSASASTR